MNSLPQEVIDEIIDCLPYPSLTSSSLVATRWRKRSQQQFFDTVRFNSDRAVKRWHAFIKASDPGGIPSYVRFAVFDRVNSRDDPALFFGLLKSFSSLRTLWIENTEIPSELLGHISRGEFGKGITSLHLLCPRCSFSTITSIILSLPDLKNLVVDLFGTKSGDSSLPHPISPHRRRLNVLELYQCTGGVADVLIQSQFAFRYLFLDLNIPGVQQLIMLSSETVARERSGGKVRSMVPTTVRKGASYLFRLHGRDELTVKIHTARDPPKEISHQIKSRITGPPLLSVSETCPLVSQACF